MYNIQVFCGGKETVVSRRYSEFEALHRALNDPFVLPPKRLLTTSFIPSAWIDDDLIAERKAGLEEYLSNLLSIPDHENSPILVQFLTPNIISANTTRFNSVPTTLCHGAAMNVESVDGVEAQNTMIAAAYYPDWSADSNPPEKIDFSKFDILFFAFAMPNSSSTLTWDSGSQSILQRLINAKKVSGKSTKIVLSVGGWGGSHYFSQACSNSTNRTTFVNAMVSSVKRYELDGIDIDWEYPNSEGAGNPHSSADAGNLLSLFKSLRNALPSPKILSAAVPHLPWLGTNGKPSSDVSAYAAVIDYVNIMNYDVWGASATPGPNAPLGDLCGTSTQPQATAQAALAQWKKAGFPANQQILGLPLYGYVSQSTKTTLTGSLVSSSPSFSGVESGHGVHRRDPVKEKENKNKKTNPVDTILQNTNLQEWYGQQIPFNELVKSGALIKKSDGTYGQGGGFTMAWDDCSDTPFLFKTSQKTVVTYDDTWSLGDKAQFAKSSGMAGCFTWSLDQDDGVTLQDAIRQALGK